jgi:hypothetical protein
MCCTFLCPNVRALYCKCFAFHVQHQTEILEGEECSGRKERERERSEMSLI